MKTLPQHWLHPRDLQEAQQAQQEMAKRVILEDELPKTICTIAGADISHMPFDPNQMVYGAVALLSYPSLQIKEIATQINEEKMPYIPGFLGFRESPTLVQAFQKLSERPDLLMVDGHGISHPRGLGIASHLGVLLDIPTIGVAKSILVGKPTLPLPEDVHSQVPLQWKGKELGVCLRTKKRCLPLIISAGHKISLPTAVQWVIRCLQRYRLPEPTRQAHIFANESRKKSLFFFKNS